MRIQKSWVKKYIDTKLSDKEMSQLLTDSGFEVESIEIVPDKGIIVAQIYKIIKHPNANKLSIAFVDDGKNKYRIVCGAPNIKSGQKVPLALAGSTLPGGTEIIESKIRGQNSQGMLCSENELGLGDDKSGIMILPQKFITGEKVSKYHKLDTIFEVDVTPNRGDLMSHIGIAREIAAKVGKKIKKEPIKLTMSQKFTKNDIEVEIKDQEDCHQYYLRSINNVAVNPPSRWLSMSLQKQGINSINNVVDITNYILFDLGFPMHAFDRDKIEGNKIIVRKAKSGEEITTLDGETRTLTADDLVIADKKKVLALAGIMGGEGSQIMEKTKNIVIEAAQFNRKVIRATSKRLNLTTESSYRFERGVDPAGIEYAINKVAKMIRQQSGGEILKGIVYEGIKENKVGVKIEYEKINKLLGTDIEKDEIDKILKGLEFEIEKDLAFPPSYRHDVSIWQDLAEEVGRMYGYKNILPRKLNKFSKPAPNNYHLKEMIKDKLVQMNLVEMMNYPYLSWQEVSSIGETSHNLLEIINPLQEENRYLRNSLLPGLIRNISKNPSIDPVEIFEIGNVFFKSSQKMMLAIALSGKRSQQIEEIVEKISQETNIPNNLFKIKKIEPEKIKKYKIKKLHISTAQICLEDVDKYFKPKNCNLKIISKKIHYRSASKYPSVSRDLAFIVDESVDYAKIEELIYQTSNMVYRVELFDEYVSHKFGKNKKNIAFHIDVQSNEKSLTEGEARVIFNKIINTIAKTFKAKLRK